METTTLTVARWAATALTVVLALGTVGLIAAAIWADVPGREDVLADKLGGTAVLAGFLTMGTGFLGAMLWSIWLDDREAEAIRATGIEVKR